MDSGSINTKVIVEFLVKGQRAFQKSAGEISKSMNQFGKGLKKEVNQQLSDFDKRMNKANKTSKRFQFEWLGIMFFGMAMKRMFVSMLRPAAELFGLFDIWNTTLAVMLLPTMSKLAPYFYDMSAFFMDLPEDVQESIGALTLFGAGVGQLGETGGQIALGILSLDMLIERLGGVRSAFTKTKDLLIAGLAIGLVVEGIQDISEGKILEGIGQSLVGVGWFIPGPIGKWAMGIGIALIISEMIFQKDAMNTEQMLSLLVAAGFVGSKLGGPYGIVIAIALALIWINKERLMEEIKTGAEEIHSIMTQKKTPWQAVKDIFKKPFEDKFIPKEPITKADFIMRPGQAPVSISPNDTLVGAKSGLGGTGGIVINQTITVSGSNSSEFEKLIKENNSRLVDDIKRMTNISL